MARTGRFVIAIAGSVANRANGPVTTGMIKRFECYIAPDGDCFALVSSAGSFDGSDARMLSQDFTADAGDEVRGWALGLPF